MAERAGYEAALVGLPRERTALLPGLHRLQDLEGFVSLAGLRVLAGHIRVPAVEVHAAAATYNELRFAPAPAGLLRVCTGLACRLHGGDRLLAEAQAAGRPTETVACLFACGVAPLVELDGRDHGHADRATSAAELRSWLESAELPAPESVRRVLVGGGSCGRAAGSAAVSAALVERLPDAEIVETGCDGACWAQPVIRLKLTDGSEVLRSATPGFEGAYAAWSAGQERRLTARMGHIDPASIDDYLGSGGYEALQSSRTRPPAETVDIVEASGLLGRGGAYFPTARKWRTAIESPGDVILVVNIEEGEPGVFKDRHLCEGDPHAVLEGILIAAHALSASQVFIYVNGQADLSAERLEGAVTAARASDLVPAALAIELRRGAGGYVCGEESVILNSIEGQRAVPRPRPPLPAVSGLWGQPTIVNNAETLALLPLILRPGADWFRFSGTQDAPGTKLLSVSGAVPRGGLVEVPFGTPFRAVIEGNAGAAPGRTVAAVAGGPSGGLLPERLLDGAVRPGLLDEGGAILGAGGISVVDGSIAPLEVARHLTAYNAAESCGKCTPCREGTARTEDLLRAATTGGFSAVEAAQLEMLNETLRLASLCGLGQAAPNPVTSLLLHFPIALSAGSAVPDGLPATIARAERAPAGGAEPPATSNVV